MPVPVFTCILKEKLLLKAGNLLLEKIMVSLEKKTSQQ